MYNTTLHTTAVISPVEMLFHNIPNNGLHTQSNQATIVNLITQNKTKNILTKIDLLNIKTFK